MTDEEVHVVLKKILEGDYRTVASLNKAKRGGVVSKPMTARIN